MEDLNLQTRKEKDVLEIFKTLQRLSKLNRVLRSRAIEEVDMDIFYQLIKLITEPKKPFNEEEIERYFKAQRRLEKLRKATDGFQDTYFSVSNFTEYQLFGMNYNEINQLEKAPYDDDFDGVYFCLNLAFIQGRMEYQDFIQSVRVYLEASRKVERNK